MEKVLRIGSVGTSAVMETMQEALRLTPGVICEVVYSRSAAHAREYADSVGVEKICDDYEALVSMPELDAVYLASPNSLHASQTIAALEHGKHVIVEKPAAGTVKEIHAMRDAARANGVFFFEAITTVFMPNMQDCKAILPRLGRIRSAEIRYGKYSSRMEEFLRGGLPSVFNPAMQGGALNDLGIYCIHTALELFGVPDSLRSESEYLDNGVDIADTVYLSYPDFCCKLLTSKCENIGSGTRIEGEHGRIVQEGQLNDFGDCRAELNGESVVFHGQGEENRMIYELARFRDAINTHDTAFFEWMSEKSAEASAILEQAHVKK